MLRLLATSLAGEVVSVVLHVHVQHQKQHHMSNQAAAARKKPCEMCEYRIFKNYVNQNNKQQQSRGNKGLHTYALQLFSRGNYQTIQEPLLISQVQKQPRQGWVGMGGTDGMGRNALIAPL
jgi:hypothetical protein